MFKQKRIAELKNKIYSKISDIDIYNYYLATNIKKIPFSCKSPLRDEKHPSFGLYYHNSKILWKDFTLSVGGDIFELIKKLYNVNYEKAIEKVYQDLIEGKEVFLKRNVIIQNTNKVEKLLKENVIEPYYFKDEYIPQSYYDFWNKYKVITKNILERNKVRCAKEVYINNSLYCRYKDDDIVITYRWYVKEKQKIFYKIYRPYNTKYKWISNFKRYSSYLIHGINKIDKTADYVIITKSVKDKMVLEGLGYNAINVQNEGITIPEKIIEYLKGLYNNMYLLYDNDYNKKQNYGQLAAEKVIKQYPFIKNIKIDGRYRVTDISEFIEKYTVIKTKTMLNKLLYQ